MLFALFICLWDIVIKGNERKLMIFMREHSETSMDHNSTKKQIPYERRNEELQKLYNRPNILAFIRN